MAPPLYPETPKLASLPTHDEIARCAHGLWIEYGQPAGCEEAIWLDAERLLTSAQSSYD
ncbi:MAG: DUF2934 domain-containing protein [Opitutaceae bacterium]